MPDMAPELIARLSSVASDEELSELLAQHPELRLVLAAMQEAAPQESTLSARQELADKLMIFARRETWSEKKAYLAEHPELLTDEALEVLSMLIEEEENEEIMHILTQHRDLLAQARQKGLDEAFAEFMPTPSASTNPLLPLLKALIACNSGTAVLELATQQPELLSDEMDALLQQEIANARSQGTEAWQEWAAGVGERHETLRQLRQMMDETGMSAQEVVQAARTSPERPPQLDVVLAFLNANSWDEKKRLVEQERELLLSDAALELFADLFEQYKEDAEAIRTLTESHDLLMRCRKEGIEAAFAALMTPSPSEDTNALLPLLNALIACDSRAAILELAAQQPELLSDEVDAILQQDIANARSQGTQEDEEWANYVALYHEILRQLRQMMDETGMSAQEVVQAVRTSPERLPQLVMDVVLDFLNANSWDESKRLVEQERELLLSDAALELFADLFEQYKEDAEAMRTLTQERDLLIDCRKEGIEAAFAKRVRFQESLYGPISDELHALITEIEALTRVTDTPRRIELCHRALRLVARDAQPLLWAVLQSKLGSSYDQNPLGEPADNIEQAISCYQQALEAFTRQALPTVWASTINNLAFAYYKRIKGQRADNLELAITYYQQALSVITPQALPLEWATMINNLANAYLSRIKGERADNLELAISYYQQALSVRTRQALPLEWAQTMNKLALAYCERIKGERADNLEQAISCYQQALEVQTRQALPLEWAITMNKLAALYKKRIKGERADNLELVISCYQQALEVQTRQALPLEWANTINNLALAYYERIKGERADNLELVITCYQQALEVRTRQALPIEWAITMNNLALALHERIKGERVDNLEQAISYYQQALEVRTRQALPVEWALTINNLALAYCERIKGEPADNLELAISYYQQALEVHTRQALPVEWASTINNLANTYYERINGEPADNLELAISYYQQALEVRTRQALPLEWAQTINNLAAAYRKRIKGEPADNVEIAISCYSQALELFQPEALPHDCRRTAYLLGCLLYDEGRFAEARDAFVMAHEAAEFMRDEAIRKEERERLAEENAEIYARLVYCCLAEGDEASAFKYAAAGKGRAFVDLLSSAQIDLENVPDKALQEKVAQAGELKARQDGLVGRLLGEATSMNTQRSSQDAIPELSEVQRKALSVDVERLRQEDKKLWEEIRQQFPDYFATQSAEPFTLVEAHALAQQLDASLVSYYRHYEGWVAFVIRPDVAFDSALRVVALSVTTKQLFEWWLGFNNKLSTGALINLQWSQNLSDALIAPLLDHLPSPVPNNERRRLVIAPFWVLHRLPFASLPRRPMPWRKVGLPQVRYLSDEIEVTITPSLAMLKRVMDRQQRGEKRETLCAIAYPGRKGSKHYLAHVLPEAEAIAPLFTHTTTRLDGAATREAAIQDVTDVDVAHYSCHGLFDPREVEQSGLLLASGMLTLRDIFNEVRLKNVSLVTLSACQTGLASVRHGDELAGMVQGFVYAGTPAVIASLWAVDDAATRYLFERFYERYTTGMAAAHALRRAQQELRQNGYAHPYYWAAFQAVGAAYDSLPTGERAIRPAQQVIQPPSASQKKGIDVMNAPNPQAILAQAEELLQQIELFATPISQELTSEERNIFISSLQTLISQTSDIASQSQLIQLASQIISAFEAIPLLRDFLLGNIDPATEQQKRHLTIQEVEQATKPQPSSHQEPQKMANTYSKMMSDVVELLQEKKEEAQGENGKPE